MVNELGAVGRSLANIGKPTVLSFSPRRARHAGAALSRYKMLGRRRFGSLLVGAGNAPAPRADGADWLGSTRVARSMTPIDMSGAVL